MLDDHDGMLSIFLLIFSCHAETRMFYGELVAFTHSGVFECLRFCFLQTMGIIFGGMRFYKFFCVIYSLMGKKYPGLIRYIIAKLYFIQSISVYILNNRHLLKNTNQRIQKGLLLLTAVQSANNVMNVHKVPGNCRYMKCFVCLVPKVKIHRFVSFTACFLKHSFQVPIFRLVFVAVALSI